MTKTRQLSSTKTKTVTENGSCNKTSRIVVDLTNEPGMIDCVNACGLFSTSDHNVLCWTTNVVARTTKNSDVIRNYNKADIASIRKDLSHVNWELDSGRNVHELWYVFRNQIKLEALRPDKASGPDDIPPRLLRELSEELCHPLTVILQKSIDEGVVPDDWKFLRKVPDHKQQTTFL